MEDTLPAETLNQLDEIAKIAAQAKHIAVLTGAGVSAESGIPTFREAQTGLWAKHDPVMLASPEGFAQDPAQVWRWYDERRQSMGRCKPNPGHVTLAQWEQNWRETERSFRIVTQNIDGLHERAGSKDVIELHGNIWYVRPVHGGLHEAKPLMECPLTQIPPVDEKGRILRPHVVWFGEMLDRDVLEEGIHQAGCCDLMLVAGTSSIVYPAAALPYTVLQRRAVVIEINPNQTELSQQATYSLRGASGVILPELWRRVTELLKLL